MPGTLRPHLSHLKILAIDAAQARSQRVATAVRDLRPFDVEITRHKGPPTPRLPIGHVGGLNRELDDRSSAGAMTTPHRSGQPRSESSRHRRHRDLRAVRRGSYATTDAPHAVGVPGVVAITGLGP